MNQRDIDKWLSYKVWAVVGASNNTKKFGYKIYQYLKKEGYTVYPINPGYQRIGEDICYGTLTELPQKPDVINMVVNPKIGVGVVQEASELGITKIWLQPGTVSNQLLSLIKERDIEVIQACVLAEIRHQS